LKNDISYSDKIDTPYFEKVKRRLAE